VYKFNVQVYRFEEQEQGCRCVGAQIFSVQTFVGLAVRKFVKHLAVVVAPPKVVRFHVRQLVLLDRSQLCEGRGAGLNTDAESIHIHFDSLR
jgi:hypothetical protein